MRAHGEHCPTTKSLFFFSYNFQRYFPQPLTQGTTSNLANMTPFCPKHRTIKQHTAESKCSQAARESLLRGPPPTGIGRWDRMARLPPTGCDGVSSSCSWRNHHAFFYEAVRCESLPEPLVSPQAPQVHLPVKASLQQGLVLQLGLASQTRQQEAG